MPICPTPTCSTLPTLLGIYAEGHYLYAEFEGGSMMRYEFPSECMPGVVNSFDVEAGTWEIERGDDLQTFTTAELLEDAKIGEVEFYLGLYNRYHFEFNDPKLDATEWLSTTRTRMVYAPTLNDAYKTFHERQHGATNVRTTSLQLVRGGKTLVRSIAA